MKLASVIGLTQQCYPVLTVHGRQDTISQKFGLGSQFTNNREPVLRRDVEKGGDGRVVGDCKCDAHVELSQRRSVIQQGLALLRDVESPCAVWVIITAAEELPEYGVVSIERFSPGRRRWKRGMDVRFLDALGLNVPSCEIVLQHANESFFGFGVVLRTLLRCTTVAEEHRRISLVTRRKGRRRRNPTRARMRKE